MAKGKYCMQMQIYDFVVRVGGVPLYRHTVAVFPHDQRRSLCTAGIWPTCPQTGRDEGGAFSNGTDFKSFTYLFICPVQVVPLPDANVTGFCIYLLFFGGLARTFLSINIRTVGGTEASWAAGRQMVLESVSDARRLLRKPAQTGTDAQKIDAPNKLPEKLSTSLQVWLNSSDFADKPFR